MKNFRIYLVGIFLALFIFIIRPDWQAYAQTVVTATLSGNNVFTGTNTFNGPVVTNDGATVSSLNKVCYADQQVGADVGAQINACYTALPSTGGIIRLSPGSYTQTTPVTFTTVGKLALLDLNGSTINYTPITTTTAFTLNYGAATPIYLMDHGIINGILVNNNCATNGGCGSSATAISLGTTPAVGPDFSNLTVQGFGKAIDLQGGSANSWGAYLANFTALQNTTGLYIENPYENCSIYGGKLVSNGTGLNIVGNSSDCYAFGTSFDANTTIGILTAGVFECHGCHFENNNGAGGGVTTHYIDSTGGSVALFGGNFVDDQTTGSTDWWIRANSAVTLSGPIFFSGGRTATQVVEVNSPGHGYLEYTNNSSGVLTSFVGGSAVGSVTLLDNTSQTFIVPSLNTKSLNKVVYVDGTTYADTRAGLQAALTAAGVSGEVVIPPGVTITMDSTPISITNAATSLQCGTGSGANNQAILLVTNTTADVFDITAGTFSMRGCSISLTGITGARSGVAIFNASNNSASGMTIENVNVQGSTSHNSGDIFTAYGSSLNYTANWQVTQVNISGLWTTAFKVGSTSGTVTQFHLNNLVTYANSDFSTAEILLDSGTDTFQVNGSVLWNGTAGGTAPVILTQNVLGSQTPRLISFQQSSIENHNVADTTFGPAVTLTAVQGFEFNASPYIGNTQYVAQIGAGAIAVTFSNDYVQGVQQNCFTLASGSVSTIITGNTLQDCGEKTNNTYPAIDAAAGASRFTITNNTFSKFAASNLPSTEVTVETGASDHYLVTTNSLGVSGTDFAAATAISDNGSGSNKIVTGNIN